MQQACIGIGTNVGDRLANVNFAIHALDALGLVRVLQCSNIYETPPVGPVQQGAYFNAALRLETSLPPAELRRQLAEIELQAGREPQEKRIHWGPRVLDLDLLLYEDQVIDEPELRLPHPRLHERWFALKPLADVAPDWVHPVLHRTVAELLKDVAEQRPDDFEIIPRPRPIDSENL